MSHRDHIKLEVAQGLFIIIIIIIIIIIVFFPHQNSFKLLHLIQNSTFTVDV